MKIAVQRDRYLPRRAFSSLDRRTYPAAAVIFLSNRQRARLSVGMAHPEKVGLSYAALRKECRPDGTVGHAYLGHLRYDEIEATLNELAIELGAALGQERIYVAFAKRA
jgi:hypothetical protein